ncbi:MAG: hypothetical protein V4808_09020 [Pseudomonadota bacterium]
MLAALLLSLAIQDQCFAEGAEPNEMPQPAQAAGDGLWIGGIRFYPADIATAEPHHSDLTELWELQIRFTASGSVKFQQAQRCGVGHAIEISVNRRAISRPNLAERILGPEMAIGGGWPDRASVELVAATIRRAQ